MNALLWTLVVMGGINVLAIMYCFFLGGGLPRSSNSARFLESLISTALAVWAAVLLVGGR